MGVRGLEQLRFSTYPFPHSQKICVSLTGPHFSAAVIGAAALWGHGQLNYFKVFLQKLNEIEPKI